MKLFKRHKCPPRQVTVINEVQFCSHEHLIPMDKRKKYALKLHQDLHFHHVKQIKDFIEKSGYKIVLTYNGNAADLEEWLHKDA